MKNKKTKKSLLSAVILTYNSKETIIKCLKSLENQKNKNFEVLIIDDDSTDDTLNLIKKTLKEYSFKIRFFRNGRHNISRGRNIGIKNARTRYIAFLDSDAYADKNWVKNILLEFKKPGIYLVGGDTVPIFSTKLAYANSLVYESIRELARKGIWSFGGGNCALDKNKIKNYFNENFIHCEDMEFFSRIRDKKSISHSHKIRIKHINKETIRTYLGQQYKYGIWETAFSYVRIKKGNIRLLSLLPSIMIIASLFFSFFSIYSLLLIPIFCLFASFFVFYYKKLKVKIFPYIVLSFLIKIIGWGAGVLVGFYRINFDKDFIRKIK